MSQKNQAKNISLFYEVFQEIYKKNSYEKLNITAGSNNNNHNGAKTSLCSKLRCFFFFPWKYNYRNGRRNNDRKEDEKRS